MRRTARELKLAGVFAHAITPHRAEIAEPDYSASLDLMDFLASGGVQAITLFDAAGEFLDYTFQERQRLVYLASKRSRVPLIAGVSHSTLSGAIQLADEAICAGADGLLLMPPYFFRYSQPEIAEFYIRFARETPDAVPVLLHNIPQFTSKLEIETVRRIVATGRFAGIEDSSGDWTYFESLLALKHEGEFAVFAGNERIAARALHAGADGLISSCACAVPELLTRLAGSADVRDEASLAELLDWIEKFPMPVAIQRAVELRGQKAGASLVPLAPETASALEKFSEWFKKIMREFREWGHKLVDWIADYLDAPERYSVLSAIQPNGIVNAIPARGPDHGETMDRIFADFERLILPGITHWNHPGFLAYFANTSSPPAILAELLAAALNANGLLWKTSPAVTELEIVTLRWLLDWLGLPPDWFGMILDTASTSNLHALAAARARACPELRDAGAPRNLVVYCSDQAHSSVEKGAMALGFGRNNVHKIPTDAEFRMRPDLLTETIRRDRAAGFDPCCIVATVGTTSTTSVDPVPAIADIAARENIWLHIDAAYAGSAAILPEFRWLLEGCERADSLVFNPHKWLMVPVDCSVLYCRDRDALRQAFSLAPPEYLEATGEGLNMADYGVPLGRRFRALKLWFVLRYYGREGLAQIIRDQIEMTRELRDRIAADPRFEIRAPGPLSVICFRLKGPDEPNRELLEKINGDGRFFLSHTVLNGRFVLRIAIGNMKTTRQTLEALWNQL